MRLNIPKIDKPIAKETSVIVFSGLVINYPLSIIVTWILITILEISSPLVFATAQTLIFTVVSWTRVYFVRKKMSKKYHGF